MEINWVLSRIVAPIRARSPIKNRSRSVPRSGSGRPLPAFPQKSHRTEDRLRYSGCNRNTRKSLPGREISLKIELPEKYHPFPFFDKASGVSRKIIAPAACPLPRQSNPTPPHQGPTKKRLAGLQPVRQRQRRQTRPGEAMKPCPTMRAIHNGKTRAETHGRKGRQGRDRPPGTLPRSVPAKRTSSSYPLPK